MKIVPDTFKVFLSMADRSDVELKYISTGSLRIFYFETVWNVALPSFPLKALSSEPDHLFYSL